MIKRIALAYLAIDAACALAIVLYSAFHVVM